MTSLLDAIRQAQKPAPEVQEPVAKEPLVIDPVEWAHFIRTGECPFEEIAPGLYQHVVTRQTYRCWDPYVLPGEST